MKGFTLLEVAISMVILGIIVTATLPGYNNLSARINLRRTANEVALVIREAQAYAFAVKGYDHDSNPGTPLLFNAWGINFDTSSINTFSMFVDLDSDESFDANELVRTIPISNGIKIRELAAQLESDGADVHNRTRLDIVYQRPNPDTTLTGDGSQYSDLEIILENSKGDTATIVVWQSGQISVK